VPQCGTYGLGQEGKEVPLGDRLDGSTGGGSMAEAAKSRVLAKPHQAAVTPSSASGKRIGARRPVENDGQTTRRMMDSELSTPR
jgi:hypothetical protein